MPELNLNQTQLDLATKFVPDLTPDPKSYVKLVSTQVLGTDRDGNLRPPEDLFYFLQVCKNAGLDPMLKQIYAVYRWNSRVGKETMSIQTSIDGLRLVAEKSGNYAGSDDAIFETDENGRPVKATVTVYKVNPVSGERMPTTATARYDEYVQLDMKGNPTQFWKKMPFVMLAKVAESLALRKAFPNIGQIYTAEEMSQAESVPVMPAPKKLEELKEVEEIANEVNDVLSKLEKASE